MVMKQAILSFWHMVAHNCPLKCAPLSIIICKGIPNQQTQVDMKASDTSVAGILSTGTTSGQHVCKSSMMSTYLAPGPGSRPVDPSGPGAQWRTCRRPAECEWWDVWLLQHLQGSPKEDQFQSRVQSKLPNCIYTSYRCIQRRGSWILHLVVFSDLYPLTEYLNIE